MRQFPAMFLLGAALHFCILVATLLTPRILDWRVELAGVPKFFDQVIRVHGAFIALTVAGLGVLSLANADELAAGGRFARWFCAFVAIFWGTRLVLQFAFYEPGAALRGPLMKLGYHCLAMAFALLTAIYGWGALPR